MANMSFQFKHKNRNYIANIKTDDTIVSTQTFTLKYVTKASFLVEFDAKIHTVWLKSMEGSLLDCFYVAEDSL